MRKGGKLMYFNFKCSKCCTGFTIPPAYMQNRVKILCPSCDTELSTVILEDLKAIASSVLRFEKDYEKNLRFDSPASKYLYVQIADTKIE